jgi:hypothetical protein
LGETHEKVAPDLKGIVTIDLGRVSPGDVPMYPVFAGWERRQLGEQLRLVFLIATALPSAVVNSMLDAAGLIGWVKKMRISGGGGEAGTVLPTAGIAFSGWGCAALEVTEKSSAKAVTTAVILRIGFTPARLSCPNDVEAACRLADIEFPRKRHG